MLGDMSLIALDHGSAGLLIAVDHFAQFFRVELFRERGGTHQVTEHHGQLPPLAFGPRSREQGAGSQTNRLRFTAFLLFVCCSLLFAHPNKDLPIFISCHLFRIDEFCFQVFQIFIIDLEAPFQRTISDTTFALYEVSNLRQYLIKCHEKCPCTR